MHNITYAQAILDATDHLLETDPSVYLMGLGVPDPKGIFGTTTNLHKKYPNRSLDMPVSENGMTGIAIGSAIRGMRPIMTHQRVDFMLLALDQLINNAAKWRYMFNEQMSVPLVIRLIIGRGWGQGPQHSQTLHSLFAHIPGLKVVAPANAYDAKGLLISAVYDNNPVIFFEHRWLHNISGPVPKEAYRVPIGEARILQKGTDLTIVASSHMTLDAYKALPILQEHNISAELIDLRTIRPLDTTTILESVKKTGRLLVLDPDYKTLGLASEIITVVIEQAFSALKEPPQRLTYPDALVPTAWTLSNHFYPTHIDIANKALAMFNHKPLSQDFSKPLDTPDKTFTGPF